MTSIKHFRLFGLLPVFLMTGCNTVVMNPFGDVAAQESHLIVVSTLLMLLIIVPVIALTLFFAWRYRASNNRADYDPDWNHSTKLELIIWGAPLVIIIALGLLTWITTHTLDPYRPLERIDANRTIPSGVKPLNVEVVAMDWKWLFIYPDQGIAVVNDLAAPVDTPINFKITATSVMNSFYVPALAGQVYAMPGMQTQLHAVINKPGDFEGFSANYSGAGFSHMHFKFHGMSNAQFDDWVKAAKASGAELTPATYLPLAQPSQKDPVRFYASVSPNLFDSIINRCVEPGKMCVNQMMAIDAATDRAPAPARKEESKVDTRPGAKLAQAQLCAPEDKAGAKSVTKAQAGS